MTSVTSARPQADDPVRALDGVPLLAAALSGPRREVILGAARVRELAPGSTILEEGTAPVGLTLLVAGEAAVWKDGRLVTFVEGPRPLELAPAVLGRPAAATYRAEGPVTVARVPGHLVLGDSSRAGAEHAAVVHALAEESAELDAQRFASVVAADDFFRQPNAELVPGPYRFGPFVAHLVVVRASPAQLAALLPPGVHPLPGFEGRYVVALNAIEDARVDHGERGPRYRYHEVTPFLPCVTSRGRPGLFVPELYPDAYMAILLGREIYGFPKRLARTVRRDDGVDVIVDQRRLVRARWGGPRALDAAEYATTLLGHLMPGRAGATLIRSGLVERLAGRLGDVPASLRRSSVFVRKRILSARSEVAPSFQVDELVEVPFTFESMDDFTLWERHDVRFAKEQGILVGDPVAVLSARIAFRFGAGFRRRDYRRRLQFGGAR